jgi:ribosomal protein S5
MLVGKWSERSVDRSIASRDKQRRVNLFSIDTGIGIACGDAGRPLITAAP